MAKSVSAFTGGKLNLKGDKKRPAKKNSKNSSKHGGESSEGCRGTAKSLAASSRSDRHGGGDDDDDDDGNRNSGKKDRRGGDGSDDEDLTPAEKRSRKFKSQRERKEMEQVVRWVPFWPVRVSRDYFCFSIFGVPFSEHEYELTFIRIFILTRFFLRSLFRQHEPPRARGAIQRKAR
jgi:hypothetical protein